MSFDLSTLKDNGLYRERLLKTEGIDFASNDYLSLANCQSLRKAYQKAFLNYPLGAGGSMVVCGYHPIHHKLEDAFCESLGVDKGLLFTSGYVANLAVTALLKRENVTTFIDKSIHASVYDGLALNQVAYQRYPHQAYDRLLLLLNNQTFSQNAILIESVFSMTGHRAPLQKLVEMAPDAPLIVDEAHTFGLYGKEGLGCVFEASLGQDSVPLRVIPFGKALAGQGAVVVGKAEWIDKLLQVSRGAIYSTAMSPALAAAILATFEQVKHSDARRESLFRNIQHFKKLIATSSFSWVNSDSAIQYLYLRDPQRALKVAALLIEKGLFCRAIRHPTVPANDAGIRFVLHSDHSFSQLEQLIETIQEVSHDEHYA